MLLNVQYLRFIAALMVVLNHTSQLIERVGRDDIGHSFEIGAAGVDLFFAISGFIMVYITSGRTVSAFKFIEERLLRIAPPYWIVTLGTAALIVAKPGIFDSHPLKIGHLMTSLLFVPWPDGTLFDTTPLYPPGWTLNYEILFYGLFAIALTAPPRFRIALVSSVLVGLVVAGLALPSPNILYQFYTMPLMVEFIFGMAIGWLVVNRHVPAAWQSLAIGLAGLMLLVAIAQVWPVIRTSPSRVLMWGVPCALMVAGGVFMERRGLTRRIDWLVLLGNASYAIYLTHYFVVGAVGKGWSALHLSAYVSDAALVASCAGFSILFGVAFHIFCEKPLLRLLKSRVARTPAVAA
ncbi:MAG: acyltransferase [Beijerinckiaceae bacterium]|nr:acyltransferase [Beijerinckiaceae bacterium]